MDISNKDEQSSVGQAVDPNLGQTTNPDVVPADQYKSLEAEYTRRRQSEIDAFTKLAQLDAKSLIEIGDIKTQNAVVKRIYWLDSLQAVKAVYWENFFEGGKSEEDLEISKTDKLERELNILKYTREQDELNSHIRAFKAANPDLSTAEHEDKLRAELNSLSKDIPMEERIKKATILAFPTSVDNVSAAYQKINQLHVPASAKASETKSADEIGDKAKSIMRSQGWIK